MLCCVLYLDAKKTTFSSDLKGLGLLPPKSDPGRLSNYIAKFFESWLIIDINNILSFMETRSKNSIN
jgi:hypothetical protein